MTTGARGKGVRDVGEMLLGERLGAEVSFSLWELVVEKAREGLDDMLWDESAIVVLDSSTVVEDVRDPERRAPTWGVGAESGCRFLLLSPSVSC